LNHATNHVNLNDTRLTRFKICKSLSKKFSKGWLNVATLRISWDICSDTVEERQLASNVQKKFSVEIE